MRLFAPQSALVLVCLMIVKKPIPVRSGVGLMSTLAGRTSLKLKTKFKETSSKLKLHLKKVMNRISRRASIPITLPEISQGRSPSSQSTTATVFTAQPVSTNTKVVTDIDDTIVSSGGIKIFGVTLGGVDNQYKRGSLYPGAIQFAFELSHSQQQQQQHERNYHNTNQAASATESSDVAVTPHVAAKVSVLTARAKELKYLLKLKQHGKVCTAYRNAGQAHGVDDWGIGDMLVFSDQ